ncbi:polyprenyl synthetase family protein [Oxalobacter paraformigenes]|uniref:Geranyl transferase n=1 Tax=Oxalobacter paraformigenes TaxID=556268 RepID=C3X5X9_9BURK|nr:farnesyl diphosphate synthase [Oxalobacter paraformigenes]EEO28615.2 hypothetical protein OFAG_01768 [Oxalobacter paraformigenes]
MSENFNAWLQSVQSAIEKSLSDLLPSEKQFPEPLHQAMRYAVLDGGKRIRPLLVFATGALFGAPVAVMTQTASAVEMIHAYSLIHDDMPCMDNDVLRRGKPTLHVQFGEAMALLAGDALQAQAFIVLSKIDDDAKLVAERLRILSEASGSLGMCGGQAIDLDSVGKNLSIDQLEQMHRLKTGALLKASVMLGAFSAKRPDPEEITALDAYAKAIGLAFQVVDDILDVTADTAILGKTAGKDASDHKPTYVSLLGLENAEKLAEKLRCQAHEAIEAFGKKAVYLHELADLVVYRKK